MTTSRNRMHLVAAVLSVCLIVLPASATASDERDPGPRPGSPSTTSASVELPKLSSEEIFSRLVEANTRRARALKGFTGRRHYNLDYRGFPGNRAADMVVAAAYMPPATKDFSVLSESGSKLVQTRVLRKLLESEKEATEADNQRRTAMTPENYSLTLVGTSVGKQGGCYRLKVEPRRDNKFLYRGEICVNAADFAIESIDAEPAKNPSFWISKTRIEQRYSKVGEFWLPVSNKSWTKVRLGGTATLTIEYKDYKLE